MPQRTISVLVIAYNHEDYIREALDSILAQRVNARVEIVVADDCSTDQTVSCVKEVQKLHPDKIILLETKTNLGHTHNYARAWAEAKGDYIAHCDGDDFWIDPLKLSKQLEFLENNPSFSSCANKIKVISGQTVLHESIPLIEKQVFTTEDLLDACYPHNSSLFFRNRLFDNLPNFFFELTGHDWCISVLNSLHGPLKILPESMSVWRIRNNGLWGGRQDDFHLEHTRVFLQHMGNYLPDRFKKTLLKFSLRNSFHLAELHLKERNFEKSRFYFKRLLRSGTLTFLAWRPLFSLSARLYCFPIYNFLRQLRNLTLGEPPAA